MADLQHLILLILHGKREGVVHILFPDLIASTCKLGQLRQNAPGLLGLPFFPQDLHCVSPGDQRHVKCALDLFCKAVKLAEYMHLILSRNIDGQFIHSHLSGLPFLSGL